MRRWMLVCLWMSLMLNSVQAQDPSIPVGLSEAYLVFAPIGWQTESPNPFGFVQLKNDAMTLNVLDPIRFESFIPYDSDASPRQLLIDYTQFFYVETLNRQDIDLLTIGDNTVALYIDPDLPQLATYIVELADQRFAVIEVEADDGMYDDEEPTVNAIMGTLTLSTAEAIRTDVLYDTVVLPSGDHKISLPQNWRVEPSLVPGQLFLVGDGIDIIFFPPDSLDGYFTFPADIDLIDLARVIEAQFFDVDLANTTVTNAQAGNRHMLSYGLRSLTNQTDTQVLMVQSPDGGIAFFKTVVPQESLSELLQDRIRRIALSLESNVADTLDIAQFDDPVEALIVPNSGEWRLELRDMMRYVCDGTIEYLIPLSDEIRLLFGDFDTIVADPDGESLTIASDGVVSIFQRGTLQRVDTPYFEIADDGRWYTITPLNVNEMIGRLNIVTPQEEGNCRLGVSLTLRYVE